MIEINITHWPFFQWKRGAISANGVGWLALVTTIIAGATYSSFAKNVSQALSPLTLLFLSELLTALIVLFSFGTVPLFRRMLRLPRRSLLPLLAVGILNSVIAPLLWFAGLRATSAVNASLFGNSDVLFNSTSSDSPPYVRGDATQPNAIR